jgi:hypothetical protein
MGLVDVKGKGKVETWRVIGKAGRLAEKWG